MLSDVAGDEAAVAAEFITANYADAGRIPPVIYVQKKPESVEALAAVLSDRRGAKVRLVVPSRGEMKRFVLLARANARESIIEKKRSPVLSDTLELIGRRLKLGKAPDTIDCIDISNLSGREAVGSVVVFSGGEPDKSRYRIYNIRTLDTPNDYGMMREVLLRRYAPEGGRGARAEAKLDRPLPDLLLVDGGLGQLSVARRALKEAGIRIPMAAIAKGEKKGRADTVFIPDRKNPLPFKRGSRELLLLMRIRDEAHRFGIGAHRHRRLKKAISK